MRGRELSVAVRDLLALDAGDLSDGQLLGRFVEAGDDDAFAQLVRRHGALVWGVCQRIVGHQQDAEDAFQATFLVLARRAGVVRPREQVAGWLHGVARRTALKARATARRRQQREKPPEAAPEPAAAPDSGSELRAALDAELAALPDMYRVAVVLCDLEDKTGKEAARELNIPEGTLATRLRTARQLLARRLARRGVALAEGALGLVVSAPAGLVAVTAEAVRSGTVTGPAAALAKGVISAMVLTKWMTVGGVVLAGLLLAVGGVAAAGLLGERRSPPSQVPPLVGAAEPETLESLVAQHQGQVYRAANEPGEPIFDIRFGGPTVDDAAVRKLAPHLAQVATLRALSLAHAQIGDEGVRHLTALGQLDNLDLARTPVTDAGLRHLAGLKGLRSLNLAGTPVVGSGLAHLAGLPQLRHLNLSGTRLTAEGLGHLGTMRQLETLSLSETPVPVAALEQLAGLRLAELHLPRPTWNDAGLKHYLAAVTPRTRLNLRFWNLTDAGLQALAGQRDLHTLVLTDTPLTDAGLAHLASLPALETLHLTRTRIQGTQLGRLAALKQLKTLWLPGTLLEDKGTAALASLKQVQSLNLNGTAITDASIDALKLSTGLRELQVGGTKLTPGGMARLREALPQAFPPR